MSSAMRRGGRPRAATGPVRLLRICALTAASMALAVGAHAAGGGRLPGAGGLLLLSAGVALVAGVLTSVRLRGPVLVGVVGIGQWLLHHALMALSGLGGPAQTLTVHAQHGSMTIHADGSAATMGLGHGAGDSATMLGWHVVATVLTAWLLARGEAALWRVVTRLVSPRPGRRPRVTGRVLAGIVTQGSAPQETLRRVAPARGPPRTLDLALAPAAG